MISIGVAAAQVGVSPSALRKWESRYGLPTPQRAKGGARGYTLAEVERLKDIKRRIDRGQKPAQALPAVLAGPAEPARYDTADSPGRTACSGVLPTVMGLLRQQGPQACHRWLDNQRRQLGVRRFVQQLAGPLMTAVGEGWAQGQVAVYEEHCLAAVMQTVLDRPPDVTGPCGSTCTCLLATLSGERHTLGLSMLGAVLQEQGIPCVQLGASVPNAELVAAAQALGVAVVAVSLSLGSPPRVALRQLQALRAALPAGVALWVGGTGVGRLARVPEGVRVFVDCGVALDALAGTAPDASFETRWGAP